MARKRVGRIAPAAQTFYVFVLLAAICGGPFFFEMPRPDDAQAER